MVKPIIGYEGLYQIIDDGRVISLHVDRHGGDMKLMKPQKMKRGGYLAVILCKEGRVKLMKIHRLVAINFIPNPENYPEVNHKNGVKIDNRVSNLEWCTRAQNRKHAQDMGLNIVGSGDKNPRARTIIQSHLDGRFVQEWTTIKAAMKKYGRSVRRVLEGSRKTAYGYLWNYAN